MSDSPGINDDPMAAERAIYLAKLHEERQAPAQQQMNDLIERLPPLMASIGGHIYNREHLEFWQRQHREAAARIKELEAERDKLRKALERACEGLEYAGHGSDDPEVCPACKVYDDIRAVLAKPPVEEGK